MEFKNALDDSSSIEPSQSKDILYTGTPPPAIKFENALDDSSSIEPSQSKDILYTGTQPPAIKFENTLDVTEPMEPYHDLNPTTVGYPKQQPLVEAACVASPSEKDATCEFGFTFEDELPQDSNQKLDGDAVPSSWFSKRLHKSQNKLKCRHTVRRVWLADLITHILYIIFGIPIIVLSAIDLASSARYHTTHHPRHSNTSLIPTKILVFSTLSILSSFLCILYSTTYLTFYSHLAKTQRLPRNHTTLIDVFLWLFIAALAETNLSIRASDDTRHQLESWGTMQSWRIAVVVVVGVLQICLQVVPHVRWGMTMAIRRERKRLRAAGIEYPTTDEEGQTGRERWDQNVPEIKYVH